MTNSIVYKTVLFNELGSTPVGFSPDNMMDGLGIFSEEVKETEEAIYLLDEVAGSWELSATKTSEVATSILDSAIDSVVTAIGILYRMGMTAEQINEAFEVVADSNLSKFPQDEPEAQESVENYAEDPRYTGVQYKAQAGGYVVFGSKSDGTAAYKILKGIGFVDPEQELRKLVGDIFVSGDEDA